MKQPATRPRILRTAIIAGLFCLLFLFLFSKSMHQPLSHDEHQFVASGELLASRHMIPYKDYPYFHMPDLVFVYAAIFAFTDHLLLAARTFSVICACLLLGVIFFFAMNLFRRQHDFFRFLVAAGSVVLLMTNGLFAHASGLAWNHDLPMLCILLAFVLHCRALRQADAKRWFFATGTLLGLAVGTRLSFLPAVIPFLVTIFLSPGNTTQKRRLSFVFSLFLGFLLPLLPSLFLCALAPEQFLFGSLEYPALNVLYRQATGYHTAMTASGKLIYFMHIVTTADNVPVFLFFALLLPSFMLCVNRRGGSSHFIEMILSLLLIPCLLIGAFVPTPSAYQYFYAPIPFLLLSILYAVASFDGDALAKRTNWRFVLLIFVCMISVAPGAYHYRYIGNLFSPREWIPVRVHHGGAKIAAMAGHGKVLTLAPIFPLEGGATIYEELATGPFAWRIGPFLPARQRARLKIVSRDDLGGFLRKKLPRAILTGHEGALERPFRKYAKKAGYEEIPMKNGRRVWIAHPIISGN